MRILISDSNNVSCPNRNKLIDMGNCYCCKYLKYVDIKDNSIQCKYGNYLPGIDYTNEELNSSKSMKKPPLELKPRFIVEQGRIGKIRMAMNRYIDEFKTIPLEWIFEYNDLAHRQRMTNGKCK